MVYGNKASTKVAVSFDTGCCKDKLKIDMNLDKEEDLLVVPEEKKANYIE